MTGVAADVDVAIIGAGQAGLATSWYLSQAGVEHVILDAGRVAETWRTRRWDSFRFVTPNWGIHHLPGATLDVDPDGFLPLTDIVKWFVGWASSFRAPVRERTSVSSLEQNNGTFLLRLEEESITANKVVVATGGYQRAHRPLGFESLPRSLHQILAEDYRNPSSLPPGGVLVVGSGQTGCQIADELADSGRDVYLACGRCAWTPRRIEGKDFVWWSRVAGFLDRKVATPGARLYGNVQSTGHRGGYDLHYRTLHARGVKLLGRFAGADGSTLVFADDVWASVDFGDARLRDWWKYIENYCRAEGRPLPDFEWPEPFRLQTPTEIDAAREGITSVIWTSGYRLDFSWIQLAVFDDMGFPIQDDGRAPIPGLYFMGVPWMRKFKSSILYGVAEDAQLVAEHIIENRA
jgi:putative flavoprotein involved in K+ transport